MSPSGSLVKGLVPSSLLVSVSGMVRSGLVRDFRPLEECPPRGWWDSVSFLSSYAQWEGKQVSDTLCPYHEVLSQHRPKVNCLGIKTCQTESKGIKHSLALSIILSVWDSFGKVTNNGSLEKVRQHSLGDPLKKGCSRQRSQPQHAARRKGGWAQWASGLRGEHPGQEHMDPLGRSWLAL